MRPIITLLIVIFATGVTTVIFQRSSIVNSDSPPPAVSPTNNAPDTPVIQLALVLDTSNSMDGLIDQARSQLWRIVEELNHATYKGVDPILQVALYSYGNDTYSLRSGYIRQDLPFTQDLDSISAALFDLRTKGGSEYAGMVLDTALQNLKWSDRVDTIKLMYIAGNESFNQGPTRPLPIISRAKSLSIQVHPIYCGAEESTDAKSWRKGAQESGVHFFTIDHDKKTLHIDAPQDKELAELSQQLNATYIPFGQKGQEAVRNQQAQDTNASRYGLSGTAKRSIAKSSKYYRSASWDLVEAIDRGNVQLSNVPPEKLPKEMRAMSKAQQTEYVDQKRSDRHRIKARIRELSTSRNSYVTKERQRLQKEDTEASLDQAILKGLHQQAEARGFTLR